MADIASISKARETVQRLRSQLANVKDDMKRASKLGTDTIVVVAGGVAAGLITAKMPTLLGTTVPTAGLVGAGITALAMSGMLDEQGDHAALFGAGILAAVAAGETEKLLQAA